MTYEDSSTWRLKTDGGIPYRILEQSGSFEEESASASVTFLVPADRLVEFALEVIPTSYSFQRSFPVYPYRSHIPGTQLYAKKMTWKAHIDGVPIDPFGFDANAPDGTYQPNAEVTVEFSTPDTDSSGGGGGGESDPNNPFTFLEVSANTSGQFVHSTAPKAKWKDDDDPQGHTVSNKLSSTPVTILVPMTEWNVRWPRIPHDYYQETLILKLRILLGTVNDAIMPIFFNALPETILFVGFSLRQQFTWRPDTQPPFQLNMKFLEKCAYDVNTGLVYGHNHVWKADQGWQRLLINGKDPIYKLRDLNWLFRVSDDAELDVLNGIIELTQQLNK